MSGFAPAHQHSSNSAWLSDVADDIVLRMQSRRGSSVSGAKSPRSWGPGRDDGVSSFEESDATAIMSPVGYPQHGLQDINSSRPRLQSRPHNPTHSSRTGSQDGISQSSDRRTISAMATDPEAGQQTTTRFGTQGKYPVRGHPRSNEIPCSPGARTPKAHNQMRPQNNENEMDFPTLEKRLSTVSEFSGFQPHPAVRPLEPNGALRDAANPSNGADDSASYPGPLALSLIVLGICLSVFIISLDRNIITTVFRSRLQRQAPSG